LHQRPRHSFEQNLITEAVKRFGGDQELRQQREAAPVVPVRAVATSSAPPGATRPRHLPTSPGLGASSSRRGVELSKFRVAVDSAVWGSNLHIYVPVSHKLDGFFDGSHSRVPSKGHGPSNISAGDHVVHEILAASRQAYRRYMASARSG
jgi:hypothetical protein